MKANIYDVARLAGVSSATVSRVINGNYLVKPETREQVLNAIEKLNFIPNHAAVSLSGGKSKVVGYICPKILNLVNMYIAAGIEHVLNENGYGLFIASTENSPEKERDMLKFFQERMVDLVILATCQTDGESLRKLQESGLPIVLADRYIYESGISTVKQDNIQASYDLTKYLIDMGHRDIAIVNGLNQFPIHNDRQEGFLKAMKDANIPIRSEFVMDGQADREKSYQMMENFIRTVPKDQWPTAIYSTGELMTQGVVQALQKNGISIPDDISVVSYGAGPNSGVFTPTITGVDHKLTELGNLAAKLALNKLKRLDKRKDAPLMEDNECMDVPSELFIGESVKKLSEN